nr:hypothetical protein [Tanacetum cinerariifolium]
MSDLESRGKLDRAIEFLPAEDQLAERIAEKKGLTRAELSVLISYSKIDLKEALLESRVPDDDYLARDMETAFPPSLGAKFSESMRRHRLKREIVSTQIANDLVNHMGITFVQRLKESTGMTAANVAGAYVIVRDIFHLPHWFRQIEALDYKVPAEIQLALMDELMRLGRRATRWFLRSRRNELDAARDVAHFGPHIAALGLKLDELLEGPTREVWQTRYQEYVAAGVPELLARMVAGTSHLYTLLPIIEASDVTGQNAADVAKALAREAFRDDIDWQQRAITVSVLQMPNDQDQGRLPGGRLFRLRRVIWKPSKVAPSPSNQGCLLLVWFLLRRNSLTPTMLRGPAPNGHPCPDGALAASMRLDPLRIVYVQPAPKSRLVAAGLYASRLAGERGVSAGKMPPDTLFSPDKAACACSALIVPTLHHPVTNGVVPQTAFGFETEFAIQRQRGFVVGKYGQFDTVQVHPVVRDFQHGSHQPRPNPFALPRRCHAHTNGAYMTLPNARVLLQPDVADHLALMQSHKLYRTLIRARQPLAPDLSGLIRHLKHLTAHHGVVIKSRDALDMGLGKTMDHHLIDSRIHWIHPLKTERSGSLSGQLPTWLRRPPPKSGGSLHGDAERHGIQATRSMGTINAEHAGAGLLAKAVCQAASSRRPPAFASKPAPTEDCVHPVH